MIKKAITAVALLTAVATTSANADTATVFNFDTGKKHTIYKTDVNERDLQCIAKLSAVRDAFSMGNIYGTEYNQVTKAQDKIFLKYPFTIPTKWINGEKDKFLDEVVKMNGYSGGQDWIISQISRCL